MENQTQRLSKFWAIRIRFWYIKNCILDHWVHLGTLAQYFCCTIFICQKVLTNWPPSGTSHSIFIIIFGSECRSTHKYGKNGPKQPNILLVGHPKASSADPISRHNDYGLKKPTDRALAFPEADLLSFLYPR